ncbi:MAG TPA: 5-(carboxyamino)imidazole ribonucleotide synthase [Cyclobacteriaceae bacterium]|jgi:5-(carboxyamino)imidazole ribonucleotide synthase|nr:5-(carboxyamino)imidazole ribonucleotide synthase [Cytophagales bacterium]HRE65438.1 5-(carboxyamino)imidazole ribonucleotide synthase [Cyclobacteriaceae bacterium]HRF32644.1 5-(carboxyamino)imidazole ribonucleotide synthase [Cyclobacteriaceae bacterium]
MAAFNPQFTIGVLGGGQLGRMLIQSGINLDLNFHILDPDPQAPCAQIARFTQGKLTDYETVMAFGNTCDIITIEIENVNTKALTDLEKAGKKVFPQPAVIELIQDKRLQKQFFTDNQIPTAPFMLVSNKEDVIKQTHFLPAVNKLGKEGYDGRGVQVIKTESDLHKAFDAPGLLEKWIPFEKEIAVIVSRNAMGEVAAYPAVEMVFHPEANLVEYLFSPAQIDAKISIRAEAIARKVITELNMIGLLAVEMFVTKEGEVLVNEVAPRPHNSGHQTIEGNVTSQYEQHLRAILNLPAGSTALRAPSAMVNLLGEEGFTGNACYEGLEEVLKVEGIHVHLYGKKITKPYRKMGHVTIVDSNPDSLKKKANFVKQTLKVKA